MKVIYCALFYLLLTFPLITQWIVPIPNHRLRGVTKKLQYQEISLSSLLSGKLQKTAERRIKEHMKLWPYLVKTENQLNVSLFEQISTSYSSAMVLGKSSVLMHRSFIRHANRLKGAREKQVLKTLEKLSRLNQALQSKGIKLLLLISPNKPTLYPEHLPDNLSATARHRKKKSLYDLIVGRIHAAGIPTIDAYALFKSMKTTQRFPIFPASGSHWSDYCACLISSKLTESFEQLLGQPVSHFSCSEAGARETPLDFDRDHASVANVWFPQKFLQPTIAVQHETTSAEPTYKPRVTIVGTSFMWSILRYLDRHRVYSTRDFYFYFKTLYQYPGNRKRRVKPKQIDWDRRVFVSDVIVLEINEAWLGSVGYGFIKHALRRIETSVLASGEVASLK